MFKKTGPRIGLWAALLSVVYQKPILYCPAIHPQEILWQLSHLGVGTSSYFIELKVFFMSSKNKRSIQLLWWFLWQAVWTTWTTSCISPIVDRPLLKLCCFSDISSFVNTYWIRSFNSFSKSFFSDNDSQLLLLFLLKGSQPTFYPLIKTIP